MGQLLGKENYFFHSGGAQDEMETLQRAIAMSLDKEVVYPRGGETTLKEKSHEHSKFQAERRQRI